MGLHFGDSVAENLMMMIELFQPNHLEDTQRNICVLHMTWNASLGPSNTLSSSVIGNSMEA